MNILAQKSSFLVSPKLIAIALCLVTSSANAQWPSLPQITIDLPKRPEDLNPWHPGGTVNKSLNEFDQRRLDEMSFAPRAGRDFTRLHLHNNSRKTIHAAVRYVVYRRPSTGDQSTLSSSNAGGGGADYTTQAWYTLRPGESAYVGDTSNNYFYTFAKDDFGGQWSGHHNVALRDGNRSPTVGFEEHIFMAGSNADWTQNFDD